ncbi:hypothetical protein DIPPA_24287 [Diplonema papillatum]|nr:hypothetical protein DIPPA_24287 [Diplonema papillatum]
MTNAGAVQLEVVANAKHHIISLADKLQASPCQTRQNPAFDVLRDGEPLSFRRTAVPGYEGPATPL